MLWLGKNKVLRFFFFFRVAQNTFTASRLPVPAASASTVVANFEIASIAISFKDIFTRKLHSAHK